MHIERQKLALVLISAVVIAAGCVENGDSESSQTNPVEITDFSPSQNPAPADTTLRLNLEAENTGAADAEDAAIRVFGPSFASNSSQDGVWRTGNQEPMSSSGERTFDLGTIEASTEESPSLPATQTISLTTPSYSEGRAPTDVFNVNLFYKYKTQADTSVSIMSEERFRESDETQSQPTINNDPGPIQMEAHGQTPKVQYDDEGEDVDELCVIARNEGTGTPFDYNEAEKPDEQRMYEVESEHEDRVNISISDVGDLQFSPNDEPGWEQDHQGDDGATIEVELIGDEGRACFNWQYGDGETLLVDQEQNFNVNLQANYGYKIEDTTQVTVEGRR